MGCVFDNDQTRKIVDGHGLWFVQYYNNIIEYIIS